MTEICDLDDLVEREGLLYKKFSDVPFTGKTTGKIQGSFRKGRKHGPYVSYHDNGGIMSKGDYKNDKKVGLWVEYHENGQLRGKGNFRNGVKEGLWVIYNEDGSVNEKY